MSTYILIVLFLFQINKDHQLYIKKKCHQFLKTVLRISKKGSKHVKRSVRFLVQSLIYDNIEPKQFCDLLEIYINVSKKPSIVKFLQVLILFQSTLNILFVLKINSYVVKFDFQKSLPLLRHSMFLKEIMIQGIQPPNYVNK